MNLFNKIYRLCWIILIVLLIFFDRQNTFWVILTLFNLFFVSFIAVVRALESRKEWRKYIEEENLDKTIPK